MRSKKLKGNTPTVSTQKFLDFSEIKDDTVVMKDGTLRSVLLVSSINFSLKSEDEQNATIAAYVSFLNSIEFSLQMVIQSRRLNIEPYIEMLKNQEREQVNELLRAQIVDYREFINELVVLSDIMSKRFYVVVPYVPGKVETATFVSRVTSVLTPARVLSLKDEKFNQYKDLLDKRVEHVMAGLASMSLNAVRLDTQSLIELYYTTYNPESAGQEKMTDVKELRIQQ
ncbi:MAG: hypothetical protein ACPGO5_04415 [Patescibacteria group bacterium]